MIITIEPERTISEIKEEFNVLFPFLKLEFFRTAHEEAEATQHREMIKKNMPISDISRNKKYGTFYLTPATTVATLEATLRDDFGLYVQVFRKSGTVWLETTVTDNLTLQTQNALGLEKSYAAEKPDVSDFDYD